MYTWPVPLPFALNLAQPPLFSSGGVLQLSVDFAAVLDEEAAETADAVIHAFWALAGCGGLLGDGLKPGDSTTGHIEAPRVQASRHTWLIGEFATDERSWVNLALLLQTLHVEVPIVGVHVLGSGTGRSAPVAHDPSAPMPWVPVPRKPPFPIIVDPDAESDTVEFTVDFEEGGADAREDIEGELWAWAAGLGGGAFSVLPLVDRPAAEFSQPEWAGDTLSWEIAQVAFDPAALESFASLCITLHATTAAVTQLSMA